MISDAMERILQELYADARARSFELITLEQLLLALMEQSDDVQQVLEALHVDLDVLSGQLVSSIQDNTPTLPPNLMDKVETQPTLGFQRVMQRAIVHAQSVEKREVQPVDVLVALMSEKDCPAVYFLQLQSVGRVEILRYLAHGDAEGDGAEAIGRCMGELGMDSIEDLLYGGGAFGTLTEEVFVTGLTLELDDS